MKNIVPSSRTNGPYSYEFKIYDILYWHGMNNIFTMGASLSVDEIDYYYPKYLICSNKLDILSYFGKRFVTYPANVDMKMGAWYDSIHARYPSKTLDILNNHKRYKNKDYDGKHMEGYD